MSEIGKLRIMNDNDLDQVLRWRNAPSVRMNMYTRHEISTSEHSAWWAKHRNSKFHEYLIYERNNVPLGLVSFTKIDVSSMNASWAFYSAPEAGRGTGSRMEALALDHAFFHLKLHKLYCEVLSHNMAVVKLHEKFGFKIEGVFREHHKFDDHFLDIYCLAIFHEDWLAKRDSLFMVLTAK